MKPLEFMRLFEEFHAPSWDAWRGILERLTPGVRELYAICGRGSGKSRVVALLACAFACREYDRAPGERIFCAVFAPDRRQSALVLDYIVGLLESRPELAALIERKTRDRVELTTGVVVEVLTSTKGAGRGRSYALCIIEEAAFLPVDEHAAEPDVELVRALRPGLGRVKGSLLAVIGSPYSRRGILYEAAQAGSDDDRVVVTGDTLSFNPLFDPKIIEREFERDPISAASEYGRDGEIHFRSDVSALLTEDALQAVVPENISELPPDHFPKAPKHAHFDAATGSGKDAAALAIACGSGKGGAALLALRHWRPPFSPAAVVKEACELLTTYGLSDVQIDRYAVGLVVELFSEHGVEAKVAELDTSRHFVSLLALINSRRVKLLDDSRLLGELRRLERRAGSGGRDRVGHPPRGNDDVAAAAASALVAASKTPESTALVWGTPGWRVGGWGSARRGLPGQRRGEGLIGDPFSQSNRYR